jgi:KipI family sensor histidine kinase inhibitor
MTRDKPLVSLLGTTALLFEAPGETSLATQQRIWSLSREAQSWPDVAEAVPGVNNLMLSLAGLPADPDPLADRLLQAWDAAMPLPLDGRTVELPVTYGGDAGPHIADVIAHTGLGLDEIVALHIAPDYPVFAIGSHPGYCYLGGMDPRIATPRRKVPVVRLPGGAVSIGGSQTGVSASDGPSGWNTIGTTTMVFFDATQASPCLLRPGDTIRFRAARVIR